VTELQDGWEHARLADIAEVRLGRQRSPKRAIGDRMRPYLRAANVTWTGLNLSDVKEMDFTAAESETYELHPGDLLLSEASGSPGEVGKPAQYRGEIDGCCFQNTLLRVRLPKGLSPNFFEHFFREQGWNGRFASGSRGVGIHHLGAKALSDWIVPIPPIAEQERVVAAIEEAFSELDSGESALRRVRQMLKRMREATLSAAVTGRLIAQDATDLPAGKALADLGIAPMDAPTGERRVPESWAWVLLGDVTSIGSGIQKQPKRAPSKHPMPFLRVANVGRGTLDLADVHEIEVFEGELSRYGLVFGDLLVVEGNGSPDQIGRSAMWRGEIEPCVHQNHLIRVRPSEVVDPAYLELYWNSPSASRRVQAVASSTSGLYTLSTGKLKSLPVALPPIAVQARIVGEVDRQTSFVEACERAIDRGLVGGAGLRRSILKAAFEGRLVPQDPTDEPASVLLDRIRAQHAAVPRKRRARTTP
jgi:type I restriction enzyme S subunit